MEYEDEVSTPYSPIEVREIGWATRLVLFERDATSFILKDAFTEFKICKNLM